MASIIRGLTGKPSPSGEAAQGVAYEFQDMAHRGDEYVQRVRSEAAKIVQEAHAQAEQVRRAAEKAGRETAEAAIEKVLAERVGKQIDSLRPAVDGVVGQLVDQRAAWLDHWQSAAVTLAVKIAERLIRRELRSDPSIAEQWVREALSLAAGSGEITVRLSPDDHARLAPRAQEVAQSMGRLADSQILADAKVSPGGCVVETRCGSVDMRLESQLDRMAEELT